MAKILFFNPPSRKNVYLSTNVSVASPSYPSLTLATLAGNLVKEHTVKIVDLDLYDNFHKALADTIDDFRPDIIAASANTPDYPMVEELMRMAKKRRGRAKTIVGGVHVTASREEASARRSFDIIVIGEGDSAISEILSSSPKDVPGIIYRDDASGATAATAERKLIADINSLPYPAWQLFDLKRYRNSRISSRRNPVGLIETSRGCAFQCNFCNKLTFGSVHRTKEPRRVVDEMEYMLKSGFREIHIVDDSFTQEIERAKDICREIVKRGLKFPWSLLSGIRADKVDLEFFRLAKEAGCWQTGFGIESGDQDVLDRVDKRIKLSDVEKAVRLAGKAGVNTFGFFIMGLAGETEESMRRTIEFSKKLPLDIAKFDICIPYPGTPYFKELKAAGRIRSGDWSKYVCHQTDEPLFDHPNLKWSVISAYYKNAFREFYLRPSYIRRRFIKSMRSGDLLRDIYYFLSAKW